MTTLAPSALLPSSLVGPGPGPSQPPSQASSPVSPTATFSASQQAALAKAAHLRGLSNTASRPSTPVTTNALNGSISGLSLEPPPGTSFPDFLSIWGDSHVAKWLANMDVHGKCAAHSTAFREADIRGNLLLELDQPTLKEIGVASIGDRIRIINAVKQLRIRCSNRHNQNGLMMGHGQSQGGSVSSLASSSGNSGGLAQPSPKLTVTNAESSDFPRAQTHQRSRSRPAPLQLRNPAQAADLPRLIRDQQAPDSARSTTPLRPLPLPNNQQVATPNTSSSHSHSSSGSGSGPNLTRTTLPPLPPPPRVQPPLPPGASRGQPSRLHALQASSGGGRRTPTQEAPPLYAPPPVPSGSTQSSSSQTPTQAQNPSLLAPGGASTAGAWKGEYGLPSGPRPNGNRTGAVSPLPGAGRRSPSTHTKAPSFSGSATSSGITKSAPRPNTTGSHPYAAVNQNLAPQPSPGLNNPLSPIAESFNNQSPLPTPLPPTAGSSSSSSLASSNPNASAYSAGRGQYRPSTPSSSVPGAPSLDDLRRKLVKFVLPDSGHTATVNVAECNDGVEILERVLRKFGKLGPGPGSGSIGDTESDEGGLSIDGWAVYLDWGQDDGPAKPLREAELLSLCSAGPDHPVREHGLTVRKTGRPRRTKVLQHIFGDLASPGSQGTSPDSPIATTAGTQNSHDEDAYLGSSSVAFPRTYTPNQDMRNNKRASSISVLSGLGVRDPERLLDPSGSPMSGVAPNVNVSGTDGKSPSSSTFAGKIRNFLGARPPSELIATHLPAYFPYTQPNVLRRTVRQSMRFSSSNPGGLGRRDSAVSVLATQSLAARRLSRMSTATRSSLATSDHRPASMASLPPPPVPDKNQESTESAPPPRMSVSTEDGYSIDLHSEDSHTSTTETVSSTKTTPHLLPPVNFPGESFADSFNSVTGARQGATPAISRTSSIASMGRRFSYMSDLRSRRDMSDTASMLTVDEITAEVELNRRKSMAASVRSGESIGMGTLSTDESEDTGVSDTLVEEEENFEMIGEDGEEYEDELEEEEEEDVGEEMAVDEDDDAPVKSIGKRGMKWIRGALIGAGSFGSVYLGMNAMNGLLMAVKQVELPTGSGPNEQRKKSMLDALEREIDLLRELQHENIVQYLDSSSDDKHLNIFLEYVPGGSVTALLRNYGAFEEALCNHFVRQILQGLHYLHSKEIIHRDIKGANILVDNKGGIKISDFGISKKVEETFLGGGNRVHRPSLQGSVFWMAPEVVKQVAHTRKADIWSVGCLVVEMLTGNHPYPTLNQMQAIFKIGSSAKPAIPSDISPELEDFLQKTFETKHEERPDADELLRHAWIVNGPNSSNASGKTGKTKTKS